MKTPSTVQRRLQHVAAEERNLTSMSLAADGPQTSGAKLRVRAENLQKRYVDEVEKASNSDYYCSLFHKHT